MSYIDNSSNMGMRREFSLQQINDYIGLLPYFYHWKWASSQNNIRRTCGYNNFKMLYCYALDLTQSDNEYFELISHSMQDFINIFDIYNIYMPTKLPELSIYRIIDRIIYYDNLAYVNTNIIKIIDEIDCLNQHGKDIKFYHFPYDKTNNMNSIAHLHFLISCIIEHIYDVKYDKYIHVISESIKSDIMENTYRVGLNNTVLSPKVDVFTKDEFVKLVGKYVLLNYSEPGSYQREFTLAA